MYKFAIVFSVENKSHDNSFCSYQKMAVGLAYSIRQYEKDIDIYCGDFTNNKINKEALYWLDKFNVKYVNETFFNNIGKNDSFCFLRTFCKNYFAKTILDNYDFLIYLDVDVVQFNKIFIANYKFSFL